MTATGHGKPCISATAVEPSGTLPRPAPMIDLLHLRAAVGHQVGVDLGGGVGDRLPGRQRRLGAARSTAAAVRRAPVTCAASTPKYTGAQSGGRGSKPTKTGRLTGSTGRR